MSENLIKSLQPDRLSVEGVKLSEDRFKSFAALEQVLNAVPYPIMILNRFRQIVISNKAIRDFVKEEESLGVTGLRPGEFMKCINSAKVEGGCGASPDCRACNLFGTVLESMKKGTVARNEADLTIRGESFTRTYDFEVSSVTISISGEDYVLVTLLDISESKRRKMLERIFFHDIINLAGGLKGILDVVTAMDDPLENRTLLRDAGVVAGNLLEEMLAQKEFISAEAGDLGVAFAPFLSTEAVENAVRQLKFHQVADRRHIDVHTGSQKFELESDLHQLVRVLVNMLKNALEATPRGGTVEIWCEKTIDGKASFNVKNASVIPPEVQLLIFRRSFSTKGANRGVGTYSMRLLTERYLKGSVSFVSTVGEGTIFTVRLPLKPETH